MAISPNGLMAREDGQEDWLPSDNWDDFIVQSKYFGNIVMGRETYELVTKLYPDYNFDNVHIDHKVIVTRNTAFKAPSNYTVALSPEAAMKYIENSGCEEMLLIGGGKLNLEFIKRNLVTHIHLTITPYIIGIGRPFIAAENFDMPLELESSQILSKGRVLLKYKVLQL